MQIAFVFLTLLLLIVALFALQNADPVTIRFWPWQLQASVAVDTLTATAVGALMAVLLGWTTRLRRWRRGRASGRPGRDTAAAASPSSSTGPAGPTG